LIRKKDFAAQAAQVFENLGVALKSVGCTASNLVTLTLFLREMDNLPVYREVRDDSSQRPHLLRPAVTLVEVSRHYGAEFLIEIEALAAF
jgi:enamine deaminase RidA (YjgF/YER057c/UK114 family)